MGLKSIYDLNQEFQALQEKCRAENEENAEKVEQIENAEKKELPEVVKTIETAENPGVKSLSELNLEFQESQIETLAVQSDGYTGSAHESIIPIEPLLIEIDTNTKTEPETETDDFDRSTSEFHLDEIYQLQQIDLPRHEKKKKEPKEMELPDNKKKRKNILKLVSDLLFYFAIFTVLVAVLTSAPNDGPPKTLFGFSYFTVLTPSMQSEIPKGSFILVKETDPRQLEVGDNITFLKENNTTVTHKIMSIYDDYQGSGSRGFETKGVNNANPDKDIVHESNIVGKVVFSLPGLGAAIAALRSNILIMVIIFGLCVILSFLLRAIFGKRSKMEEAMGLPDSADMINMIDITENERDEEKGRYAIT